MPFATILLDLCNIKAAEYKYFQMPNWVIVLLHIHILEIINNWDQEWQSAG